MDEQVRADFLKMGVELPPNEEDDEDMFEVWDVNAAVFSAFAALDTQWRIVPVVGLESARLIHTGLDYAAVDIVLRRRGLDSDSAFADIQVMEAAVLAAREEVAAR